MIAGIRHKRLVFLTAGLMPIALAIGCSKQTLGGPPEGHGGAGGSAGPGGSGGIDYSSCVASGGGFYGSYGTEAAATQGAPVFSQVPVLSPGFSGTVVSADVNGDGLPDLVTAKDVNDAVTGVVTGIVSVWINLGGGTFASPVDASVTISVGRALALGDLNGDGKIDVAAGNNGPKIVVLMNDGTGHLSSPAYYDVSGTQSSIALGDMDGDGRLDILVANRRGSDPNRNGDLAVLLNDGSGGFAPATHFAAGIEPQSVAVNDLNGDGRLDVVTSGTCAGTVLLNSGEGTFAAGPSYTSISGAMKLVDLDGDGKQDIVFVQPTGLTGVMRGNGDGTFGAPAEQFVESPLDIATGDMNADGKADLVVRTEYGNHDMGVLLNDGSGGLGVPLNYAGAYDGGSLAVGDVSGDRLADVVVLGLSGLRVLVNGSR